jgi:uncharacterized protein involved in exopolysaccharide biosynthesis
MKKLIGTMSPVGILALSLVFGALGLIAALIIPKQYEAKAVLLFSEPGASNRDTGRAIVSPSLTEKRQGAYLLNGQIVLPTVGTKPDAVIDIIQSRAAAREIAGKHGRQLYGRIPDDEDLRDFTDRIRPEVTETGQLLLSFTARNRQLALTIVQELVTFSERRTRELGREFVRESLKFLEDEVDSRRREVAQMSTLVKSAVSKSPLALVAGSRDRYVAEMVDATNTIQDAMIELNAQEASLNVTLGAIRKSLKEGVSGEAYTDSLQKLRGQVLEIKQKMDRASKTIAAGSPEQQRIAAEFSSTSKSYLDELQQMARAAEQRTLPLTLDREAARAALQARLAGMRNRMASLRNDNMKLVNMQFEQRELVNDLERAEEQLNLAIGQLSIARLAEKKVYAPFVVLDPPYSPAKPIFPRKGIFTLGGVAFGLFIGMFLYVRRLSRELSASDADQPRLAA